MNLFNGRNTRRPVRYAPGTRLPELVDNLIQGAQNAALAAEYGEPDEKELKVARAALLAAISDTAPVVRYAPGTTDKQLRDALVEWYQASDGITVGIPSELCNALVDRLENGPDGPPGASHVE
jgi:aspartate/methionine/tyrosine aminotransferase